MRYRTEEVAIITMIRPLLVLLQDSMIITYLKIL